MLSSSVRASAGSSTGVLPLRALCAGPRTEAAGLSGTTWPMTSQSNRWRIAASCCFTVGAACVWRLPLDPGGDVQRLHRGDRGHAVVLAPRQEVGHGAGVGAPGVRVADGGGEELEEADAGPLAGRGHQGRKNRSCGRGQGLPAIRKQGRRRAIHHRPASASAR